jgi:hypothetical protein
MKFSFSVSDAGVFRRIAISISDRGKPVDCGVSAIMTSPTGREEIFLPSPDKLEANVTYPHTGGRFVTCTGNGRYQIIFQPKESGRHELKLVGKSGKTFEKIMTFDF